jgi:superfamily II DNA or RNA helicase
MLRAELDAPHLALFIEWINMSTPDNQPQAAKKLLNILVELSTPAREMLFILAFNRYPIPGYRIASVSERLARLRGKPTHIGRSQVDEAGSELLDLPLVQKVNGQWGIQPEWAWPIVRHGLRDINSIKQYENAINRELPYTYWDLSRLGKDLLLRLLQFGLLTGEQYQLSEAINQLIRLRPEGKSASHWLREMLGQPVDQQLLTRHRPEAQVQLLSLIAQGLMAELRPVQDVVAMLEEMAQNAKGSAALDLRRKLIELNMIQGHTQKVEANLSRILNLDAGYADLASAVLHFWAGEHKQAQKLFTSASRQLKARGLFEGFAGVYHGWLALIRREFAKVSHYTDRTQDYLYIKKLWLVVAQFLENSNTYSQALLSDIVSPSATTQLIELAVRYWCDFEISEQQIQDLTDLYPTLEPEDYPLFHLLATELLAVLGDEQQRAAYAPQVSLFSEKAQIEPLLPRIPRYEAWERALEGLLDLTGNASTSKQADLTRLAWRISFEQEDIRPIEQKMRKNGSWTKGRNVALKRLKEEGVEHMTEQDRRVLRHIQSYGSGWYGGSYSYEMDFWGAIGELAGHPLIFLSENPSLAVELIEVMPELVVEQNEEGFTLSLEPPVRVAGTQLIKETSTRYKVIKISEEQQRVASLLGSSKLTIPSTGQKRLERVLSHISPVMRVQSDLAGQAENLKHVPSEAKPRVLLIPMGDDFKVEVFAKPFGSEPPYLKPGEGRKQLIAEVQGERVRTQRDLDAERTQADALVEACNTLQQNPAFQWEWYLETTESCLHLLVELEELRQQDQVVVEWPKGEKLKLAGQASFEQLSLKVGGNQEWFSVDGELKLNEGQVLELRQLMGLLDSGEQSAFVEISSGQYVALTDQLRKHLHELSTLAQERKGQLGIHPLMADALDEFAELGAEFKANAAWKKQLKRLAEARQFRPELPRNLQADLRPYQEAGYHWMARLAHWGVGACLADDMGLGKTVQALALMLQRAQLGPALVVAPASVVRNWMREAEKFTPEINPILLSDANRGEAIADLGPYDLLLASYTLLQIESEKLETVEFATVVLDEAQAIKNRQTKRAKAAKSLQGSFRMITTGTPIENHLGELWSLFDFINPGLLGSLDHFNERFAVPIEKYHDTERRQHLRKLLRPFILRRRKSEVLDELPEKTEILLSVELSEAERAFYEALRREAVDKLSRSDAANPGEQRMKILAEITRLRQAACHPDLVAQELGLSSSKLKLFGETLLELRQNGHKALVFSQFVRYLRIVEAWIQAQGISYQYLDGQTPLKQREERVKAFQQGQGDVFLISLKAGGVGLNLTAADYVLHLDPWWNPAVEDQASDRAHRIGQQRPVTVYRLVAEGTIEEKIVRLHGTKRELADSLLEGTDSGAKLSSDELLALIREG